MGRHGALALGAAVSFGAPREPQGELATGPEAETRPLRPGSRGSRSTTWCCGAPIARTPPSRTRRSGSACGGA